VTVEYIDLGDYIIIASAVTGLDVEIILKVANLDLADSALHAPAAGFGDTDFYPDFVDKDPRPTIDDAESAMLAVAAGDWDETQTAAWLGQHLRQTVPD
jgi:hypothetical protein